MLSWTTPGVGLLIGGHRGAAGEAPENTLAGFEVAAEAGVDYVELDVQLSADGVAVVFHDDDLDRTTDGTGLLTARSIAELGRLDAGGSFGSSFRGARIPTLEGFLVWLAGRPGLGATFEAKGPNSGVAIARALKTARTPARISICSFSALELRSAAAIDPAIPRMLIVDRDDRNVDPLAAAADASANAVNVPFTWLTVEAVHRLHHAGWMVAGGTVDEPAGIAACLELGIDAVDTNRPTLIVPVRDALRAGSGGRGH
jgi:glycerophosphoryl diester phosphodiesterase